MSYQKIVVAALCAFCILMLAALYRMGGAGLAGPLAVAFLMLATFGVWVARRAGAWRAANPGQDLPANPLSLIGGCKTIVLMTLVTTTIAVGLMVLLHARI